MNEQIVNDTLRTIEQISMENLKNMNSINLWFWISIAEFILLLILCIQCLNRSQTNKEQKNEWQKFRKESLKDNVDFDNIINSSFHAAELYDRLKVICHPDRFPLDMDKNRIAENLFQEIEKNKNNINRLKELQQEASDKLGINL